MCRAVASPTEEPYFNRRLSNNAKDKIPTLVCLCQEKKYTEKLFHYANLKVHLRITQWG